MTFPRQRGGGSRNVKSGGLGAMRVLAWLCAFHSRPSPSPLDIFSLCPYVNITAHLAGSQGHVSGDRIPGLERHQVEHITARMSLPNSPRVLCNRQIRWQVTIFKAMNCISGPPCQTPQPREVTFRASLFQISALRQDVLSKQLALPSSKHLPPPLQAPVQTHQGLVLDASG